MKTHFPPLTRPNRIAVRQSAMGRLPIQMNITGKVMPLNQSANFVLDVTEISL